MFFGKNNGDDNDKGNGVGYIIVLAFVIFIAGLLSFLSPCSLPILPGFVAATLQSEKKHITKNTLLFFLGLSAIFSLLGMFVGLFGEVFRQMMTSTLFNWFAGGILIVLGVMVLFDYGFSGPTIKVKNTKTSWGAFIFGAALGLSWTPCIGPILVGVLILAGSSGSAFFGGFLLFMYAVGLGIPLLVLAKILSHLNKKSLFWKVMKGKELKIGSWKVHSTTLITSGLLFILGLLILSGSLASMNSLFGVTDFQIWLFSLEEVLIGFVN